MGDNEATRNGFPVVKFNTDDVRSNMGKCVTRSSRNQYTNEFSFVLNLFEKGKPLNTIFLDPWVLDKLYLDNCRDRNKNWHPIYRKNYKYVLCDFFMDSDNCPILMSFLTFGGFYGYISLHNTERKNTYKRGVCSDFQV